MKTSIPAGGQNRQQKENRERKRNFFPNIISQNEAERRPLNGNFPNKESCYLNIKTGSYRTFALHVSASPNSGKFNIVYIWYFSLLLPVLAHQRPLIDANLAYPTLNNTSLMMDG